MNILDIVLLGAIAFLQFLCLKKLDIISRDTTSREELEDAIEKFAALAADRKKKVVAFSAKKDED